MYKVRYRYFTDKEWTIKGRLTPKEVREVLNSLDLTQLWAMEVVANDY